MKFDRMNRYLIRAVKYLMWLIVIFIVLYALMTVTGTARVDARQAWTEIYSSSRGVTMIVVIVLLAAAYPSFGFVRRRVNAGITKDRESILRAFGESGFSLVVEGSSQMVFKASAPAKKIRLLWEDTITVTADGEDRVILEGIRRETVRIEFRLNSYTRQWEN